MKIAAFLCLIWNAGIIPAIASADEDVKCVQLNDDYSEASYRVQFSNYRRNRPTAATVTLTRDSELTSVSKASFTAEVMEYHFKRRSEMEDMPDPEIHTFTWQGSSQHVLIRFVQRQPVLYHAFVLPTGETHTHIAGSVSDCF